MERLLSQHGKYATNDRKEMIDGNFDSSDYD